MFILDRRKFLQLTGVSALSVTPGLAHAGLTGADVFTSAGDGLLVDSTVIMGEGSAVVVDAQFTAENATALADMITATGRTLETVVITHFHPDHLLGLPILLARFPDAKAVAHRDVQAQIAQILPPMHSTILGDMPSGMIAPTFAVPEALQGDAVMLEGERIEVLPPMAGDTALITPLHIPAIDTLIASDIAFADTHLWMEEAAAPGGVDAWRASVATLRSIGAGTIIPGHRKPDSANDSTVLDDTVAYLDHWEAALAASSTAEELSANLMRGQEALGFAFATGNSVAAVYPEG